MTLFSLTEAAARLGIPVSRLRKAVREGRVPCTKPSSSNDSVGTRKRVKFTEEDLEYIRQNPPQPGKRGRKAKQTTSE